MQYGSYDECLTKILKLFSKGWVIHITNNVPQIFDSQYIPLSPFATQCLMMAVWLSC